MVPTFTCGFVLSYRCFAISYASISENRAVPFPGDWLGTALLLADLRQKMEPTMGIGPMTSSLPKRCAASAPRGHSLCLKQLAAGKASGQLDIQFWASDAGTSGIRRWWWGKVDSNYRRLRRQIYSLLPLATRAFPRENSYQLSVNSLSVNGQESNSGS